jgi:hypothetical protein
LTLVKQEIQQRFNFNLTRAGNLIQVYDRISQPQPGQSAQGRRSVLQSDTLRAATVFLHATLEDFLRSIAYWKFPTAGPDLLNRMALAGQDPNEKKFTLGDLHPHRGKTIDAVLAESTNQHLERSTYNNTTEISAFLTLIGINVAQANAEFPRLAELMLRRHQIVHRADRHVVAGSGHHRATSIRRAAVDRWLAAVRSFGNEVLALL